MREPAAEPAEDVVARELTRAPGPLDSRTEEVERVHVQGEMPEPAVHEHVRDDRPPRTPEVVHLEPQGLLHVLRTHDRQLQEVDRDVNRDQPLHSRCDPRGFGVVGDLVGHAGPATALLQYTAGRYSQLYNPPQSSVPERAGVRCTPDAEPSLSSRPGQAESTGPIAGPRG